MLSLFVYVESEGAFLHNPAYRRHWCQCAINVQSNHAQLTSGGVPGVAYLEAPFKLKDFHSNKNACQMSVNYPVDTKSIIAGLDIWMTAAHTKLTDTAVYLVLIG